MIKLVKVIFASALLCAVCISAYGAVWNITYPRALSESDQRNDYYLQILSLALDQTGVNYRLLPSERIMLQGRAIRNLIENREINVIWSMTDAQREKELLPIHIPLQKGLIGWRVFLVREDRVQQFEGIERLAQLTRLTAVQGADWPDTKILQANGVDVVTSPEYHTLFAMLNSNQADYFPRSIAEVEGELAESSLTEGLVIESRLSFRYPTAMYFFVNRSNKVLARLLNDGLEKAIASGQFDALFNERYQAILENARLNDRLVFELDNPLMPESTPLDRAELWYRPE
ncbi:transporter substrate-binding domain-containing protein [Aestuariibacter salexigens]|uniref:transporter substrate-binding domain-containing protein n=1 Tax=Aestuariibacter salexigens TaxID=226010 RepID=UPI0005564C50|nr:transporter substrate-binding domain-containing protein [Aestuariibacter salexigens]